MRNIWRLFTGDLKRLRSNVMTVIAVIGLVALPSIFSWYNMLACWDVFGNTGNLTIAVANDDEGYMSDLVPIRVNIGDQVVKALRENDQLNWVFTDSEDAIDGTSSGRYYAAVVIPGAFSRDMMSFYSSDVEHASIIYYSNEKKNAIAPKVTDQGADQVSRQINETFTETLSEVGLSIASALTSYTGEADISGYADTASEHLARVGRQMESSGKVVSLYADIIGAARTLVEDAGSLLVDAQAASKLSARTVGETRSALAGLPDTVNGTADALSVALAECQQAYSALPEAVDSLLDTAAKASADGASELRLAASDVSALAQDCRSLSKLFGRVQAATGNSDDSIASAISRLNLSVALQEQTSANLVAAAGNVETTNDVSQEDREEISAIAEELSELMSDTKDDYEENLAPVLADFADTMEEIDDALSGTGDKLAATGDGLANTAGSLAIMLREAQGKLKETADELTRTGEEISGLGARFAEAASTGDASALREIIGSDPAVLARAISAPIQIDRHAVFPVENFGSAMSPLYTTLALWIGALLIMVTLKVTPTSRTLDELDNPTKRQVFIGRFGIVALLSLMQSTTIALGNLFFLGVQAVHPWLYMACFWISGLAFTFIIYTLVVLFANLGKALAVVLLIVQVSGGGGSFPLKLLPDFFQTMSPYLPITHAVNAMRAAMFGIYNGDFWFELGTLGLLTAPLAVLGIVLIGPLSHVVPKFVERVESSKLM